ncbi:hypothetical protein TKK_0011102 [Trichogramma kaykai]
MESLKKKISEKSMDNTTSLNSLLSMLHKVKSLLYDEGIDVAIVKSVIGKFYPTNKEYNLMLDDAIDKLKEIDLPQDLNTNNYAEIDDNVDNNNAEPYLMFDDTNYINCFQNIEKREIAMTQDLNTKEYAEIVMPDGTITKVPIIDLVEDNEEACKNSLMFKCAETSILNDINVTDLDFILKKDFLNQDTMNIGTDDVHQICTPATSNP